MKKLFFVFATVLLVGILTTFTGCKKGSALIGTTWRASIYGNEEYITLQFTDSSTGTIMEIEDGMVEDRYTFTYTMSSDTVGTMVISMAEDGYLVSMTSTFTVASNMLYLTINSGYYSETFVFYKV